MRDPLRRTLILRMNQFLTNVLGILGCKSQHSKKDTYFLMSLYVTKFLLNLKIRGLMEILKKSNEFMIFLKKYVINDCSHNLHVFVKYDMHLRRFNEIKPSNKYIELSCLSSKVIQKSLSN